MAFFDVTQANGMKILVNSETIKFCEPYNREQMRSEITRERNDLQKKGDLLREHDEALQKALVEIDILNTTIHFTNNSWHGVRETADEIRQLSNAAIVETIKQAEESKRKSEFQQTPPPRQAPGF